MRRSFLPVPLLAAALAFAACGESSTGGKADAGGVVGGSDAATPVGSDAGAAGPDAGTPPSGICEALADAVCDRLVACGKVLQAKKAACVARLRNELTLDGFGCGQELDGRIAAGMVVVDQAKLQACLAAARTWQSCGNDLGAFECGVPGLIKAVVPLGGTCLLTQDCLAGGCTRTAGTCGGTCTDYVDTNAACDGIGILCDPATDFCEVPDGAVTGSCKPVSTYNCNDGNFMLVCPGLHPACVNGKCATQPETPAGASCKYGDRCPRGYECSNTCVPIRTIPAGQPCETHAGCAPGTYCLHEELGALGLCKTDIPLGSPCPGESQNECGPNAFCKSSTGGAGTCAALVAAGGQCTSRQGCAYKISCTSSICTPVKPAGGTCTTSPDCQIPLRCISGACTDAPVPLGGVCTYENDCDAGAYCNPDNRRCTAELASGATCTHYVSCPSGACEGAPGVCRPICYPTP